MDRNQYDSLVRSHALTRSHTHGPAQIPPSSQQQQHTSYPLNKYASFGFARSCMLPVQCVCEQWVKFQINDSHLFSICTFAKCVCAYVTRVCVYRCVCACFGASELKSIGISISIRNGIAWHSPPPIGRTESDGLHQHHFDQNIAHGWR